MTTCEAANSIAERDWPANLRHSPTLLVWANVDQLPIKERPFRLGRSARWPLGGVLARGEEPAATRDHLSRFRPSRPTPGINGFVAVMPHQSLLGMFHRRLDGRDDPRFDCVIRCQSEPNADLARAASLSVWEPTRRRYARSACLQHHAAVRGSRPSAAAVPSTPLWPLSCSGCPDLKVYGDLLVCSLERQLDGAGKRVQAGQELHCPGTSKIRQLTAISTQPDHVHRRPVQQVRRVRARRGGGCPR
jgi:hypothetical protein